MTRRNRLADLLRFYGDRPRAGDARDPVESERDWIDVDAEDDGDGDPEAGLPLARTFGPGTRPLTWKEHLGALRHAMDSTREDTAPDWPPGREVLYVVDPAATIAQGALVLEVLARDPRKRGGFTQLRRLGLRRTQLAALPEAADREILALLGGTRDPDRLWLDSHPSYGAVSHRYLVPPDLHGSLMPLVCRNRARVAARVARRRGPGAARLGRRPGLHPVRSTCAPIRRPGTTSSPDRSAGAPSGSSCPRSGCSSRGACVFAGERVARLDDGGAFPWLAHLRRHGSVRVPLAQGGAFLDALLRLPRLPRLELPDELKYEEVTAAAAAPPPGPRGAQPLGLAAAARGAQLRLRRGRRPHGSGQRGRLPGGAPPLPPTGRRAPSGRPRRASGRRASASAPCTRATGRARHSTCPRETWRARWASSSRRAGTSRPTASSTGSRARSRSRSARAWTGSSCTARWTSARRSRSSPSCSPRSGGARAPCCSGTAPMASCPRSGSGATGCSPPSARPRTITCASGATRSGCSTRSCRRCPRRAPTPPSPAPARSWPRSRASSRATRPRASSGGCAAISATGSDGCTSCERFGFGGCLADDMGLGKTVQVLALLESRRAAREAAAIGRAAAARAVARRGAEVARVQLEAGGGAVHAQAAGARSHGRRAHPRGGALRGLRPRADDLRHAAPGRALPEGHALRLRDPRRGPGHQERDAPSPPRRRACCAATIAWRSAARRSRTIWASCGACSSS